MSKTQKNVKKKSPSKKNIRNYRFDGRGPDEKAHPDEIKRIKKGGRSTKYTPKKNPKRKTGKGVR